MKSSQSAHRQDSAASERRFVKAVGRVGAVAVMLGAGVGLGALGTGTANAGCVTASNPATVDCDGIQHGELSASTKQAVDGQGGMDGQGVEDYTGPQQVDGSGSYVSGQAVEDPDGTQGDFCNAIPGSVPRC